MSVPDALAVLALLATLAGMRRLVMRWQRGPRPVVVKRPAPVVVEYETPEPVVVRRTLPPARVEVGEPEPLRIEAGQ